jgi:hypothetical protein
MATPVVLITGALTGIGRATALALIAFYIQQVGSRAGASCFGTSVALTNIRSGGSSRARLKVPRTARERWSSSFHFVVVATKCKEKQSEENFCSTKGPLTKARVIWRNDAKAKTWK